MKLHFCFRSVWVPTLAGMVLALTSRWSLAEIPAPEAPQPPQAESKQPTATAAKGHRTVQAADIQWQPGPEGLPSGGQMTVLSGNPAQPGPYTVRLKTPGGYKIPPHWHSADEQITVLSGSMSIGMGDTFDQSKGQALGPGSFSSMPAGMHHFAWTQEPTIIQIHGMGPFDIHYINPADDPRQQFTPTGRTP